MGICVSEHTSGGERYGVDPPPPLPQKVSLCGDGVDPKQQIPPGHLIWRWSKPTTTTNPYD